MIMGAAGTNNLVNGMPNTMMHFPRPMSSDEGKGETAFQYSSLQEMERFTLPLAYQSSLAYSPTPFLSAAVPPSRAFQGTLSFLGAANSRLPTRCPHVLTFTCSRQTNTHCPNTSNGRNSFDGPRIYILRTTSSQTFQYPSTSGACDREKYVYSISSSLTATFGNYAHLLLDFTSSNAQF
jgi:hypothetical protein